MKKQIKMNQLSISKEFSQSAMSDKRLLTRTNHISQGVIVHPDKSTPQQFPISSDLEGAYRYFNNHNVTMHEILTGHYQSTSSRAKCYNTVLILHDTTSFTFTGEREGLGLLRGKGTKQGFYCHASLCVGLSEHRDPLGLLETQVWTRTEQTKKMRQAQGQKEMSRWLKGIKSSSKRLSNEINSIHVMDREGDCYELIEQLNREGEQFVIRGFHNRLTTKNNKSLEQAQMSPVRAKRTVTLSPRKSSPLPTVSKRYPARRCRKAQLEISAKSIMIKRPRENQKDQDIEKECPINIIHVSENNCPKGQEPVSWYLLTNEPIDTVNQILFIVDAYRARWLIEELFKAIKTGCQYQKLQYESYGALLRILGIYLPVAWFILRLRYLSGIKEDMPASQIFNHEQLLIIRTMFNQMMSKNITIREALLVVAKKGGHVKNNGDPGWLVLARGMHELLLMEQGFRAAMQLKNCDQS